jgi:hypothetical protein
LLQICAATLAQASITPKDAETEARNRYMRLAAKRDSSAGQCAAAAAAAAASHADHDEDVHEEDGDQPQLQDALQDSNEGEHDGEQGSSSSSSDNESSSSDEDGPAGKPPAAGTNRTPCSRGAMAVPAAAYSHMLLDELCAACVAFKLRPQPRRKQVCVAAAGLGECSDAPDVVRGAAHAVACAEGA